ncbi:glycoside hydrolase family 16 [Colletotrichum higginsianum]|uniref:Glycoside hydrolase family 16 n=1 Tax=Colletotrichum higginsianum (strain IMI 349063) TaxID=759273 RepID=H1VVP6_COLHI|nr:glycoside hydrolase family 16 [Colletotrichum higginsianum]
MAEWKGSGKISFNTFNTSSVVAAKDVDYPSPDTFHKIKCETRDLNGKDVQAKFYLDDQLVTTQVGAGYVGKPMYLSVELVLLKRRLALPAYPAPTEALNSKSET